MAPLLERTVTAEKANGGWPDKVYAPSALAYNQAYLVSPAMTVQQIRDFKQAFDDAALRSVKAGLDLVEIHAAHGYLLHQFLSPVSNSQADEVDFLDVSSGGIRAKQETSIKSGDGYRAPFALEIKRAVGNVLLVCMVGGVKKTGEIAERFLQQGLDVVMCGRWFQKNPGLVYQFADELGVKINMSTQYGRAFQGGRNRR
ncbi:hypothetical protein AN9044.2 [Aspergillus nidulans FGSC A4]|uniref:NADH:flavin oxidoreductase/NADH oxidase N-terminal domain-containing protein n=1 Tax=Emericella nidulans (strain FGSC A4 / ATCC 38163 / CBS 112.46 / NRRL 194 / M139) TaxID=227321 RepID=Q5ARN6_EMENI|nr:hypothetical protein [Aspergillus nidulans FGSC A4]EAA64376.1 hypothetical protein AN9044.2 [Aspergillus nidulans FGSC A4]CBF84400.1 TPA: conserved hypothetical protein [Aspergillus nidulans FGSC A4]|eukprot:XP_682313.1 hypothetical protein AN9044.2 [Aspergillus nidulans FGSC A4]